MDIVVISSAFVRNEEPKKKTTRVPAQKANSWKSVGIEWIGGKVSGTGCWSACPIVKTGGPDRTVGRPKRESDECMMLMRIQYLNQTDTPLSLKTLPIPIPGGHEILIRVAACGVCHTELDEIEGRTPPPRFPIIPGHQVVGHVQGAGSHAIRFPIGQRVGVAWIHRACGCCDYCLTAAKTFVLNLPLRVGMCTAGTLSI